MSSKFLAFFCFLALGLGAASCGHSPEPAAPHGNEVGTPGPSSPQSPAPGSAATAMDTARLPATTTPSAEEAAPISSLQSSRRAPASIGLPLAAPPVPEFPAGYWDLRAVHLELTQSYPEMPGDFSQPITRSIEAILQGLGYTLIASPGEADARVTISLTGTPVQVTYGEGKHTCYTKAHYGGELVLEAEGLASVAREFDTAYVPFLTYTCPQLPTDAPFDETWPRAIVATFDSIWGEAVLRLALDDPNPQVRLAAAERLQQLGPDGLESVPELILALCRSHVTMVDEYIIGSALRTISGRWECDWEDDVCFEEWWKTQQ